ncbi:penicillin-binding transpeptidase domain-containing protein [Candidatus Chazhemtobacterium aquaticus]|uniref:Cell division protein FtsI [Peptidoglycan synthetase] n=1 Tax=Candidatus Chazhemtobacterium aquaticus TaxID=2715735 RepID=A0A857N6F6_9BACT|nr:penicillin-binding transpeptidase domain-containing protein [Candidatus Chazhemtobacterium aquaticus]QHO63757.1 Cell division protein FtsI [Peptidoglycan synthetase] [Candidatus Chazhemtobacterium aquaticus]
MMRQSDWKLVMENVWRDGQPKTRDDVKIGWWMRVMVFAVVGMILARMVFLQVVLGEQQVMVAEGNRLERVIVMADRGVIKDREDRILARNVDMDGEVVREYPYGEVVAHVIGYVGEVGEEEVSQGLVLGSRSGKMGVERSEDERLRGEFGEELVEVDATGKRVDLIGKREAVAGQLVKLNIDAELSKEIGRILAVREEEKGEYKGAVVVSRAGTGELLALVSWPSFDNNLFSGLPGEGKYKKVEEVLGDGERQPMFDRAVGGNYPPGSIYKLVTAVAGVEEGKVNSETSVIDEGEIKIDSYRYGNWYFDQYGKTEGEIGLQRALARSNDIFFYKVGEWVGVEKLGEWSRKLGLGRRTGIGLEAEGTGRVPDPLWKEKLTGERWFLGNTYHMAIGQGDLTVTPLQGNLMTAAVVSGKLCKPGLVVGEEGRCEDLSLSEVGREMIVEGMVGACSEGGTAASFFDFPVRVACKTGTAQQGGEEDDPHAWITAVVPAENSEGNRDDDYANGVVITVLLEASGEGSAEAGPVATQIARYIVEKGI